MGPTRGQVYRRELFAPYLLFLGTPPGPPFPSSFAEGLPRFWVPLVGGFRGVSCCPLVLKLGGPLYPRGNFRHLPPQLGSAQADPWPKAKKADFNRREKGGTSPKPLPGGTAPWTGWGRRGPTLGLRPKKADFNRREKGGTSPKPPARGHSPLDGVGVGAGRPLA